MNVTSKFWKSAHIKLETETMEMHVMADGPEEETRVSLIRKSKMGDMRYTMMLNEMDEPNAASRSTSLRAREPHHPLPFRDLLLSLARCAVVP